MRWAWFWFCIFTLALGSRKSFSQESSLSDREASLLSMLRTPVQTAAKYDQWIEDTPASISVVTAKDIEMYGYRTLEDVFSGIRGFIVNNDRNYSYVGVNGFSRPADYNNRILLMIDDHVVNENIFSSALVGTELNLNMDQVDRIEIVRGPGSSLYGSSAMFAVVHVITKKASAIDGLTGSLEAGSYGRYRGSLSFGKQWASGFWLKASGQHLDIHGQDLYFSEFDRPETNHGMARGLDRDRSTGAALGLGWGPFYIRGFLSSREKTVPTASWETVFNDPRNKTLDVRGWLEFRIEPEQRTDRGSFTRFYFDHYKYLGSYPMDVLNTDSASGIWIGGEWRGWWDVRSNHRIIGGVEIQDQVGYHYTYGNEQENRYKADKTWAYITGYVQDEYRPHPALSLTFGFRYDYNTLWGSDCSPRAAAVFHPFEGGTLKAIYGEAFRFPTVYEAEYEEAGYQKANPDLVSEKIKTFQVGWEQRLSRRTYGVVSAFMCRMRNLIDWVLDPSDSLLGFINMGRVQSRGIEMELNSEFGNGFGGYINGTFLRAEDEKSGQRLTNSPVAVVNLGLVLPVANIFNTAVEVVAETDRITVYGTKTPPYCYTNLHLSTRKLWNRLRVSVHVRNLFDVPYRLPGGPEHVQPSLMQNGRNGEIRLDIRL